MRWLKDLCIRILLPLSICPLEMWQNGGPWMQPGGCEQLPSWTDQKDNFQLSATLLFLSLPVDTATAKNFFGESGTNDKSETTRRMETESNAAAEESLSKCEGTEPAPNREVAHASVPSCAAAAGPAGGGSSEHRAGLTAGAAGGRGSPQRPEGRGGVGEFQPDQLLGFLASWLVIPKPSKT